MITVSLCMIVKNEEETLARCLASVRGIVDEIIIVDTGSTDRTKEIAAQFTDHVHDFEWVDDFSAARNYSYSLATKDFIMWLDADDVLLPEDAAKFDELKRTLADTENNVMMKYNTGFDDKGRVTFSYYRERLTRRRPGCVWREPVHEYLEAPGARLRVDICVTHKKPPSRPGGRNLKIYENRIASGHELTPRGMYYYARELRDHGRHAEAAAQFAKFLDDGRGWIEDNISACGEMANCLLAQSKQSEALAALTRSFAYAPPRPEICCQLGYYFKAQNAWHRAAFWFEAALRPESENTGMGFRKPDCGGYIPCVELAVCYDVLGNHELANSYNEHAGEFKPDSAAVIANRRYFKKRLKGGD